MTRTTSLTHNILPPVGAEFSTSLVGVLPKAERDQIPRLCNQQPGPDPAELLRATLGRLYSLTFNR